MFDNTPTWDEAQQDAIEEAYSRGDKDVAEGLIAQARSRSWHLQQQEDNYRRPF